MANALIKKKASPKSSAAGHGFTVVPAPKNAKRRQLMTGDDITTSGGRRSVHRRSNQGR